MSTAYNSQILSALPQYCPSCPPSMVLSLVQTESSGNPAAVSPAGAIGLFQLMPGTAAGLNVNPNDPSQNIQGGLTYLQQLYNQFGNWTQALEAYNEGPGALQSQLAAGVAPTSAGYAASILGDSGVTSSLGLPADSGDTGSQDSSAAGGVLSYVSDLTGGTDWLPYALAGLLIVGGVYALS